MSRPPCFFAMKEKQKALEEIERFFELARKTVKKDAEKARRYVKKARRKAMKVKVSLRKYKKNFCKKCNSYLIPGYNCKVRINKGVLSIKCLECGSYRRYKLKA